MGCSTGLEPAIAGFTTRSFDRFSFEHSWSQRQESRLISSRTRGGAALAARAKRCTVPSLSAGDGTLGLDGWGRTTGLSLRRAALCPLSYDEMKGVNERGTVALRPSAASMPNESLEDGVNGRFRPCVPRVSTGCLNWLSYVNMVPRSGIEPGYPEERGLQPLARPSAHGMKWWTRRVTLPPGLLARQATALTDRPKSGVGSPARP